MVRLRRSSFRMFNVRLLAIGKNGPLEFQRNQSGRASVAFKVNYFGSTRVWGTIKIEGFPTPVLTDPGPVAACRVAPPFVFLPALLGAVGGVVGRTNNTKWVR
jgi:hypothetical protein